MITKFSNNAALLLIDVQEGVDVFEHWGGPTGRRNNLNAEDNMRSLLNKWREKGGRIAYTVHDSREETSPLKISLPTGKMKQGFTPTENDIVVKKDVNSGFIGTSLEIQLRRAGIDRLVVVGFFTNFCVETTIRMAGNMGFDTYLVHDCCATTNRIGIDGTDYDPEIVHNLSVASMHGEFCTAITTADALGLLDQDASHIDRVQGNE